MLEFFRTYQTYILLCFSGICFMLAILASITKTLHHKRKFALIYIEMSAGCLVFFDRLSYVYSGDVSDLGIWISRFTNFLVFLLLILFLHAFTCYVADLAVNEMGLPKVPLRIRLSEMLVVLGIVMLIISRFTGLYSLSSHCSCQS